MTVGTETCVATLAWTGVETSFPAGFKALQAEHVFVYSRDALDVETQLTQGVHYSVTLDAELNVTVVPIALPTAPKTIVIRRRTPALQDTDFDNLEGYSAEIHESLHDAAAMRSAEHRRDLIGGATSPLIAAASGVANDSSVSGQTVKNALEDLSARIATYATKAIAQAAPIASVATYVQLAGYSAAGDGGGALYAKVGAEPAHAGKFQSADGAWWEIREPILRPEMFGESGNTTTIAEAVSTALGGRPIMTKATRLRAYNPDNAGSVFDILASVAAAGIRALNSSALGAAAGGVLLAATTLTPSAADQRIGMVAFGGVHTGSSYNYGAAIEAFSAEAWGASATGAYLSLRTAPPGATARTERMRVAATNINITPTTAATSTTTGALTIGGGIGVAGSVYLGGNLAFVSGGTDRIIVSSGTENVLVFGGQGNGKTAAIHLNPGAGTVNQSTIAEFVLQMTADQAFGGNYRRWSLTGFGTDLNKAGGIYGEYGGTETVTPFIFNVGYENPAGVFASYEYMRLADSPNLGCVLFGLSATSPLDVIQMYVSNIGAAGQRDSHAIRFVGKANDGSEHSVNWRMFGDVTSNAGTSTFRIQQQIDGGSWNNRLSIADSGAIQATVFSTGDGSLASPGFGFLNDIDNGAYRIGADNWALVAGGVNVVDINTTRISLSATTAATATTNGALVVAGGAGIAGNAIIGGGLTIGRSAAPNYRAQFHAATGHSLLQITNAATGATASDGAYFGQTDGDNVFRIYQLENADILFATNNTARARFRDNGSVTIGEAALATNATTGFLYIASCPGAPTGAPTAYTGLVPMVYDSSNNRIYFYNGSWRSVAVA